MKLQRTQESLRVAPRLGLDACSSQTLTLTCYMTLDKSINQPHHVYPLEEWAWPPWPFKDLLERDFPGGPVVKNPPANAGDMGSIPGQGANISRGTATEALAP